MPIELKLPSPVTGTVAGIPAEPASEERTPFKGKRRMIARKMVAAKTRVPHALLVDEADVSGLLAERAKMREIGEREGVRVTILPFIMKAVAGALRRHPALNASLDEDREEIVPREMMYLSLSFDHRIVDGGEATRFLNEVVRRVEASAL